MRTFFQDLRDLDRFEIISIARVIISFVCAVLIAIYHASTIQP